VNDKNNLKKNTVDSFGSIGKKEQSSKNVLRINDSCLNVIFERKTREDDDDE